MSENPVGSAEEQEAAQPTVIVMRHAVHSQNRVMYFYEGQLPVVEGRIEVPTDKPHWASRAHIYGYRMDENGNPRDLADTLALFAAAQAGEVPVPAEDESAESAEENTDEGADGGGLPLSDDGVRSGSEERDGSLPVEGLDGRDSDGSANDSGGDDAAGDPVRPDAG